ncbi:MAG: hypothetical protein IT379_21470 [Deltaproteobacteria bacterium]|nr:hypothetical protein [Deltaproteobacteria bacterium]
MGLSRSRWVRVILEELEASMTRDRAGDLVREALGSEPIFDVELLQEKVHGPLRAALVEQLGLGVATVLADRICDALARHASSGVRRKLTSEPQLPAITVGVVASSKRYPRMVAGVESLGFRAVVVNADQELGVEPAAIDAFLVATGLPIAEARELAWRNARRPAPALVVVWPLGEVAPAWAQALGNPIVLEEASFTLLARVLLDHALAAGERSSRSS